MATKTVDDENGFARQLFFGLPRRYDLLVEGLSFGQNHRWRKELISHVVPARPSAVLDVATGTAAVALDLAQQTPASITGIDLSETMLQRGRQKVAARGLSKRIHLIIGRAEELPFPDSTFDAVTFTYLLRYVNDPQATLREMARVLKPGGTMASLEFMKPPNGVWHAAWRLYTGLVLPLAARLVSHDWWVVGRFLGSSISTHYELYPLPWHIHAWERAGMVGVHTRVMSRGGGVVMWGRKADD
jgi:demethylmenaquinone methyltransferase / 2-methoxy-6-polyprenyl-1,4-benzoquinol methylase